MPPAKKNTPRAHASIRFHFEKKGVSLPDRGQLKRFIERMTRREKKKTGRIDIIFCSDRRLLAINREFLGHDYYTDIITFGLSKSGPIMAEIYISVDRIRDNARAYGTSLRSELHRVIFHGVLHLCGYGDKSRNEVKMMRAKEERALHQYFKLCST
ncbi:MAG: rRNA maturation RNase YbeY [Bacteroidota bacterium]|jgi:rRNA maturation RNase YbeY